MSPSTPAREPSVESDLGEVVGEDPASRAFRADLERVAATDATVLLFGEHGSGKSTAARAIHRLSRRSGGPFVSVHLGALSPTLIESELFGHERGAFTDAHATRLGAFRRAHGGTLVLEDVALLPLALQVKLLRALQERVVEPVGAENAVPVDLRIVATSAVDLAAAAAAGSFRSDLYFRLAVVVLEVPPLRRRSGDLAALVERLMVRSAARLGVAPRAVSPEAFERLRAHPWPGNVRELENALERTLALAADGAGPVEADELDFLRESIAGAADEIARLALARGLTAGELEQALLRAALAEERGNASAAARRVGLSRRAFEYRRDRPLDADEDGD